MYFRITLPLAFPFSLMKREKLYCSRKFYLQNCMCYYEVIFPQFVFVPSALVRVVAGANNALKEQLLT